jgi:endonuclease/exonuclease/phosphatase family metal-dependent hydrolase
VTSSYDKFSATWESRKSGIAWSQPGGDLGGRYAVSTITGSAGSQVTFDVTSLVAAVVRGDFNPSSRYTRIILIDEGAASRGSYKRIWSDDAADVSVRPTLTIVTGTAPLPPPPDPTPAPQPVPAPLPPPPPTDGGVELRVLEWNTHHGGFGTDGVYSPDRIASWAALMRPDVIMFNEIERNTWWGNEDQPEVYRGLLERKTGKSWYYRFAQEYGDWDANGKGNLILSTYPIVTSDRYEVVHYGDRSICLAGITVNGRTITLLLTHLDPYDASLRLVQAQEVTAWAAPQPEDRILAGDMNAWPDQTSIAELTTTYNDSWAIAAANGTAIAFPGNTGETRNGRIDYIFYSKGSSNLRVKSSQVYDTRDANGVMPSDHRPVLTVFEVR